MLALGYPAEDLQGLRSAHYYDPDSYGSLISAAKGDVQYRWNTELYLSLWDLTPKCQCA